MTDSSLDHVSGALVGLAVGDAVGTTLEFKPPGTFNPIEDMEGGGPFNLPLGAWTDDTSMALCLSESLIQKQAFDPADQMRRYVNWMRHGYMSSTGECFDIGNTVHSALHHFIETGQPFAGSTDPYSAGNGSLMRLAPVPMFFRRDPEQAIAQAGESSRTTHGARSAVDACRYFAGLLVGAMGGENKETLLSAGWKPNGAWGTGDLDPAIMRVARGSFKEKMPPEIKGTGYVVESLEAALWAFFKTDDFRSGCLMAANLGDDADTTAAIYGQIAGAYHGLGGIPEDWVAPLAERDFILESCATLAQGPQ